MISTAQAHEGAGCGFLALIAFGWFILPMIVGSSITKERRQGDGLGCLLIPYKPESAAKPEPEVES